MQPSCSRESIKIIFHLLQQSIFQQLAVIFGALDGVFVYRSRPGRTAYLHALHTYMHCDFMTSALQCCGIIVSFNQPTSPSKFYLSFPLRTSTSSQMDSLHIWFAKKRYVKVSLPISPNLRLGWMEVLGERKLMRHTIATGHSSPVPSLLLLFTPSLDFCSLPGSVRLAFCVYFACYMLHYMYIVMCGSFIALMHAI